MRNSARLKETLEWIQTLIDKRASNNRVREGLQEEAEVLARRSLEAYPDQLPKTVARESIREVIRRDEQE